MRKGNSHHAWWDSAEIISRGLPFVAAIFCSEEPWATELLRCCHPVTVKDRFTKSPRGRRAGAHIHRRLPTRWRHGCCCCCSHQNRPSQIHPVDRSTTCPAQSANKEGAHTASQRSFQKSEEVFFHVSQPFYYNIPYTNTVHKSLQNFKTPYPVVLGHLLSGSTSSQSPLRCSRFLSPSTPEGADDKIRWG